MFYLEAVKERIEAAKKNITSPPLSRVLQAISGAIIETEDMGSSIALTIFQEQIFNLGVSSVEEELKYYDYLLAIVARHFQAMGYQVYHHEFVANATDTVLGDNPPTMEMALLAEHNVDNLWLMLQLEENVSDYMLLQMQKQLPEKHSGQFVHSESGVVVPYTATYRKDTKEFCVFFSAPLMDLVKQDAKYAELIKHMLSAIEHYGLIKFSGSRVHAGHLKDVYLHITYPE